MAATTKNGTINKNTATQNQSKSKPTPEWTEGLGQKVVKHIETLAKGELGMDIYQLDALIQTLQTLKPYVVKLKEIQKEIERLAKEKEGIEKNVREKISEALPDKQMISLIPTSKVFGLLAEFDIIDKEVLKVLSTSSPTKTTQRAGGGGKGGKRVIVYNGREISASEFRKLANEKGYNVPDWLSAYDLENTKRWRELFVEKIEEINGKIYIHVKL